MDSRASSGQSNGGGRLWGDVGVVDQKPPVTPDASRPKPKRGMAAVGRDALKLADLQLQLMAVDVREFWAKARWASAAVLVSTVVMLSAAPVVLLGASQLIQTATRLEPWVGSMLVGGGVFGVALIAMLASIRRLSRSAAVLGRSHAELRENLAFLRDLLHNDDG